MATPSLVRSANSVRSANAPSNSAQEPTRSRLVRCITVVPPRPFASRAAALQTLCYLHRRGPGPRGSAPRPLDRRRWITFAFVMAGAATELLPIVFGTGPNASWDWSFLYITLRFILMDPTKSRSLQ